MPCKCANKQKVKETTLQTKQNKIKHAGFEQLMEHSASRNKSKVHLKQIFLHSQHFVNN